MKFLYVILIAHCGLQLKALQLKPVPYGVALSAQREARSFSDMHEVVITRAHPKIERGDLFLQLYHQTYQLLQNIPISNDSHIRRNAANLVKTFEQRFLDLGWALSDNDPEKLALPIANYSQRVRIVRGDLVPIGKCTTRVLLSV